jgi:hypothetical protein
VASTSWPARVRRVAKRALQHLADLWSYDVLLHEVNSSGTTLREHLASGIGTPAARWWDLSACVPGFADEKPCSPRANFLW